MPIPAPAIGTLPDERPPRGVQPKTTITSLRSRGVVSQPEGRARSRVLDRPFLMEHDILKVKNIDEVAWEFRWDRRRYYIKPQEVGYVPFPALCIKMGDPRSAQDTATKFASEDGQRGIIPTRYEVLCTLFAHYGVPEENVAELVDYAPRLEVRTMETDEIVTFPAQIPDMPAWPVPHVAQPGQENSDTRRTIDALTADNAEMRAQIEELRSMVASRLQPVGTPDPGVPDHSDQGDDLAAALTGATPDPGPSSRVS